MAVTRAATSKDYSARAKAKISKPKQRPPSLMIYGRYKKGKTRFCTTAPNVLILDPEGGTDNLTKAQPDVMAVERWEDLDDAWKFLRSGEHPYEWVCLDGMTRFANMALRYVMAASEETDLIRKPGMVQQRDYGKAGELMKELMYKFHALPVGKIYTAQEKLLESNYFEEEDDDVASVSARLAPEMPAGTRSAVNSIVDVIGRIYTVRKDSDRTPGKLITQRRLWLAQSEKYDTGFRAEYRLPDYLINPTVPRLLDLIQNGSTNA